MSEIIYHIYEFICEFVGGDFYVGWLGLTPSDVGINLYEDTNIVLSVDSQSGIINSMWLGAYPGASFSEKGVPILLRFASAIVDNPIVLFFVIMFAVFIGVKLLRRLCDA